MWVWQYLDGGIVMGAVLCMPEQEGARGGWVAPRGVVGEEEGLFRMEELSGLSR